MSDNFDEDLGSYEDRRVEDDEDREVRDDDNDDEENDNRDVDTSDEEEENEEELEKVSFLAIDREWC